MAVMSSLYASYMAPSINTMAIKAVLSPDTPTVTEAPDAKGPGPLAAVQQRTPALSPADPPLELEAGEHGEEPLFPESSQLSRATFDLWKAQEIRFRKSQGVYRTMEIQGRSNYLQARIAEMREIDRQRRAYRAALECRLMTKHVSNPNGYLAAAPNPVSPAAVAAPRVPLPTAASPPATRHSRGASGSGVTRKIAPNTGATTTAPVARPSSSGNPAGAAPIKRSRKTEPTANKVTKTVKHSRKTSSASSSGTGIATARSRATGGSSAPALPHWREIVDYCPPTNGLGNDHLALVAGIADPSEGGASQATTKATSDAEFNRDPEALQHLHPAEKELCRRIGLTPPKYLTTKRRLMVKFIQVLVRRADLEAANPAVANANHKAGTGSSAGGAEVRWNKTKAQEVAGIDVNKISNLFTQFQAVGWWDEAHFDKTVREVVRMGPADRTAFFKVVEKAK